MAAAVRREVRSANDRFQVLRALLDNRTKRTQHGLVPVQGVRPVTMAVEHGWTVETFVFPLEQRLSDWANGLLERVPATEHLALAAELFGELSGKDEPGELLAVVRARDPRPQDLPLGELPLVLVCDRPAIPGNLGSIVRSADAFGVDAVVVTGHAADPFDPASIRASTGSVFAVPIARVGGIDEVAGLPATVRLVGADEHGVPVDEADLDGPLALLVGNEGRGLSRAARDACAALVAIPMRGSASSLNVASATTVLLYEIDRRRRAVRP